MKVDWEVRQRLEDWQEPFDWEVLGAEILECDLDIAVGDYVETYCADLDFFEGELEFEVRQGGGEDIRVFVVSAEPAVEYYVRRIAEDLTGEKI